VYRIALSEVNNYSLVGKNFVNLTRAFRDFKQNPPFITVPSLRSVTMYRASIRRQAPDPGIVGLYSGLVQQITIIRSDVLYTTVTFSI
jgi:hypothetical protein